MKLNKTKLNLNPLISIEEFKLWARIDNDLEDKMIASLLESGVNFFEIKTNRVLELSTITLELRDERALFSECERVEILSGVVDVKTKNGATCFSGSGSVSFACGYDECPHIIKLWVMNFALNLYENRVNDYKNDAVINFYRIMEF